VPIQKCFKFNNFKNYNFFNSVQSYSTLSGDPLTNKNLDYIKVYENALDMIKDILNENKSKSGIYMITNKLTKDIYIGQSINISNRFKNYFNLSNIKSKDSYIMNRALLKYGYSNFSVTILEYCDKSNLLVREKYYLDKLNPHYNSLKIAGSSLNSKYSEETKVKNSKSLKGVYIKENSALFGRHHTEETKNLMSNKKVRENNPLFGKTHSESSIELMRQKALNREHSLNTKLKMSAIRGNPINIYEKLSSEGFKLIGCFFSTRRAAKFLGISGSTIIKYKNSGVIYKDRYKFSSK